MGERVINLTDEELRVLRRRFHAASWNFEPADDMPITLQVMRKLELAASAIERETAREISWDWLKSI